MGNNDRVVFKRFTFPHPADRHLELCLGQLRGEWVVSTHNKDFKDFDGHHGGHYFGNNGPRAVSYFYTECAALCRRYADQCEAIAGHEQAKLWAQDILETEELLDELLEDDE